MTSDQPEAANHPHSEASPTVAASPDSSPPSSTVPTDSGQSPTEGSPPPSAPASGRVKIGSQRPNVPRVRAKSQQGTSAIEPRVERKSPVPSLRQGLPPELELEVAAAFGELSLEQALEAPKAKKVKEIEQDSKQIATIVSIHNDDVFVELGGRDQGVMSLRQFAKPPEVGQKVEVIVGRFDAEDGLYQFTLPGGAIDVSDWSEVTEGALVEARITGHNKGGLECEVSQLRGFIPAGQISTYRVEDLSQFVGEKMICVVTEANPERRNLVLSRKAVLEREKAAAKEQIMASLAEGQIHEGTVRSIQDFGAFVEIGGGVDGLLHISQLSWKRVKHPSEVLTVGQKIKVLVRKIDPESGKISLAFRDLSENPWTNAALKYPVTSRVQGTVTRIMDFGAFVELEAGIEGLVHISEVAHTRVFRIADFLKVGDEIEAKVLSVDAEQQRMSLSIKAVQAKPEPIRKAESEPEVEPEPLVPKHKGPLKGGVERPTAGDKFGLKW